MASLLRQFRERLHDDFHYIFGKDRAVAFVFQRLDTGRDFPVMQLRMFLAVFGFHLDMLQVIQAFVLDGLQYISQNVRIGR